MRNDRLFLTLRTFSATGGIEKVCRIMGKALYEQSLQTNSRLAICSMYDAPTDAVDNQYFPTEYFCGYGIRKLNFIQAMVRKGAAYDTLILSHINLMPIAWLLKKLHPQKKIILLAHGIEIWYPLSARKRNMLHCCDAIFCVSNFTAQVIIKEHLLAPHKCKVLNNCLDPFMPLAKEKVKAPNLLQKYGLKQTDKILMTLCRLSSKERYKGYEKVIMAIAGLKNKIPQLKYLLAGSYDEEEKMFLDNLIQQQNIATQVRLTGYLNDEELEAHFKLADAYIMPSLKEGFGIVFIEAMHYGLPVIAGNRDGSVDALDNGNLGLLVDPDDNLALQNSITEMLFSAEQHKPNAGRLQELFSYEAYKTRLRELLDATHFKEIER